MNEKLLKEQFIEIIPQFGKTIGCDNMRLYAMEFPTKDGDKVLFADIVLENMESRTPMLNDLYVLEFKDAEILHSALDQLNLYCDIIPKQLYRKKSTFGILVSSQGFSDWELSEAKRQGRMCALFDGQNIKLL